MEYYYSYIKLAVFFLRIYSYLDLTDITVNVTS